MLPGGHKKGSHTLSRLILSEYLGAALAELSGPPDGKWASDGVRPAIALRPEAIPLPLTM